MGATGLEPATSGVTGLGSQARSAMSARHLSKSPLSSALPLRFGFSECQQASGERS